MHEVPDQDPPQLPKNTTLTLCRRGEGDGRLTDHHLDGLVFLYFAKEMEGSIGETKTKINTQIEVSHIFKSIKFLGDHDNNLTEVCVPQKYEHWFVTQISKVKRDERKLSDKYEERNQLVPRWDEMELIPQEVKAQHNPRHVKKIIDQWNLCGTRSQSDYIRDFYRNVLTRVAETGRHLWHHLEHKI